MPKKNTNEQLPKAAIGAILGAAKGIYGIESKTYNYGANNLMQNDEYGKFKDTKGNVAQGMLAGWLAPISSNKAMSDDKTLTSKERAKYQVMNILFPGLGNRSYIKRQAEQGALLKKNDQENLHAALGDVYMQNQNFQQNIPTFALGGDAGNPGDPPDTELIQSYINKNYVDSLATAVLNKPINSGDEYSKVPEDLQGKINQFRSGSNVLRTLLTTKIKKGSRLTDPEDKLAKALKIDFTGYKDVYPDRYVDKTKGLLLPMDAEDNLGKGNSTEPGFNGFALGGDTNKPPLYNSDGTKSTRHKIRGMDSKSAAVRKRAEFAELIRSWKTRALGGGIEDTVKNEVNTAVNGDGTTNLANDSSNTNLGNNNQNIDYMNAVLGAAGDAASQLPQGGAHNVDLTPDQYGIINPELQQRLASYMQTTQQFALGGDASVDTIQGNKHEQGGVNLSGKVEAEGNETMVDKYIFSDRLKIPKEDIELYDMPSHLKGKTYADASKFIEKSLSKRKNDVLDAQEKKRQLADLRASQEMSQVDYMAKKLEKFGNKYPNVMKTLSNAPEGLGQMRKAAMGGDLTEFDKITSDPNLTVADNYLATNQFDWSTLVGDPNYSPNDNNWLPIPERTQDPFNPNYARDRRNELESQYILQDEPMYTMADEQADANSIKETQSRRESLSSYVDPLSPEKTYAKSNDYTGEMLNKIEGGNRPTYNGTFPLSNERLQELRSNYDKIKHLVPNLEFSAFIKNPLSYEDALKIHSDSLNGDYKYFNDNNPNDQYFKYSGEVSPYGVENVDLSQEADNLTAPFEKAKNYKDSYNELTNNGNESNKSGNFGKVAMELGLQAGNIFDVARGIYGMTKKQKQFDRTTAQQVNPSILSPNEQLSQVERSYNAAEGDLQSISNDAATILAARLGLASKESASKAGILAQYENQNVGIENRAKEFNAQARANALNTNLKQQIYSEQVNQQERDVAANTLQHGLSNASEIYAKRIRDKRMADVQTKVISLLATEDLKYEVLPNGDMKIRANSGSKAGESVIVNQVTGAITSSNDANNLWTVN